MVVRLGDVRLRRGGGAFSSRMRLLDSRIQGRGPKTLRVCGKLTLSRQEGRRRQNGSGGGGPLAERG